MAALCLIVAVPVISRVVASTSPQTANAGWCGIHHAGDSDPLGGLPHGHPMEKCGYCGLLAGHPLLPGVALSLLLQPALPEATLASPVSRTPGSSRRLAAQPRGPPVSAHA